MLYKALKRLFYFIGGWAQIAYFPPTALKREHFRASSQQSVCPWKGRADYFDVVVDGEVNAGAAWYYPEPKAAAADIRGYVAFWRGVAVQP
ncbi:MAG: DUF427 domain-containing protein [Xanthomonadaceae bacterium]|nr:DUF427 domain-containing protein [Xanthomonadaceae bacterium]MDE2249440.1 DUF427 domain-containing protein [Xanthomonadaceae bacterium]